MGAPQPAGAASALRALSVGVLLGAAGIALGAVGCLFEPLTARQGRRFFGEQEDLLIAKVCFLFPQGQQICLIWSKANVLSPHVAVGFRRILLRSSCPSFFFSTLRKFEISAQYMDLRQISVIFRKAGKMTFSCILPESTERL